MKNSRPTEYFFYKPGMYQTLCLLALFVSQVFTAQSASAQANTGERWFQVELIAFARQSHEQSEHWGSELKLDYPLNWVALKDPTTTSTVIDESVLDTEGNTEVGEEADLSRGAFFKLPKSEYKLANHATALARDSRFRVLLHQAWRQPVASERHAPAILLQGGTQYGDHAELEGSITISVSHLLQVKTNLWLTQFEINYGQAVGNWPSIPTPPDRLKAKLLEEIRTGDEVTAIPEYSNQWSLPVATLPDTATETSAPYLPQRIVMMEEERRMRSNELHYIDHPLLGLIIRITPYSRPSEP